MHKTPTNRSKQHGFTMIELMAVVVIIGILASVAVATFNHHKLTARALEARTLLPLIKLKEEAYFQEHQKYIAAPNNPEDSKYANLCNGGQAIWNRTMTNWNNIGFNPPNPGVYFQYWINAGTGPIPNNDRTTCFGQININQHYPPGESGGSWFTVCARGDLLGKTCSPSDPAMVFGISSSSVYQSRVLDTLKRR